MLGYTSNLVPVQTGIHHTADSYHTTNNHFIRSLPIPWSKWPRRVFTAATTVGVCWRPESAVGTAGDLRGKLVEGWGGGRKARGSH